MKLYLPENLHAGLHAVIDDEDGSLWFELPEAVSWDEVDAKVQPTVMWQDAVRTIFEGLGFGWHVATATTLRLFRDDIASALVAETGRPVLSLEIGDVTINIVFMDYESEEDVRLDDDMSLVVLGNLTISGSISCGRGELIVIGALNVAGQDHREGAKVFVSGAPGVGS